MVANYKVGHLFVFSSSLPQSHMLAQQVLEIVGKYESEELPKLLEKTEKERYIRVKADLLRNARVGKIGVKFTPCGPVPWHMMDPDQRLTYDPELTAPLKEKLVEEGLEITHVCKQTRFCRCEWFVGISSQVVENHKRKALPIKEEKEEKPAADAGSKSSKKAKGSEK